MAAMSNSYETMRASGVRDLLRIERERRSADMKILEQEKQAREEELTVGQLEQLRRLQQRSAAAAAAPATRVRAHAARQGVRAVRDVERTRGADHSRIAGTVSELLRNPGSGLQLCTDSMVRFLSSVQGHFEGPKPKLQVPRHLDNEKEWEASCIITRGVDNKLKCVIQLRFGEWADAQWMNIVAPTAASVVKDLIVESASKPMWKRRGHELQQEDDTDKRAADIKYWVERAFPSVPTKEGMVGELDITDVGKVTLWVSKQAVHDLDETWKSRISNPRVMEIACTRTFAPKEQFKPTIERTFVDPSKELKKQEEQSHYKVGSISSDRQRRPGRRPVHDDEEETYGKAATGRLLPQLRCRCCGKLIAM